MTTTATASGVTPVSAASRKLSSTTPKPDTLAAALAILQTRLPHIGKDKSANIKPGFSYRYADLAVISKQLLPVMGELGLSFSCAPTIADEGKLVLDYVLRHTSGESSGGLYPLPQSGTPQQIGSAITYARRYCLCAITGVAADEDDDDARAAEHEAAEQQAAKQAARAQRNAPPEVRADGSATEAEQMRMNRGHEPGAERLNGVPADDSWYDQPPGNVLPEELPASSLPSQRQDIYIAMSKRDIHTPDARREAIERLTGRQITAAKQMSFNEAAMVLAAVSAWDGRTESLLSPLVAERSKADA